ncbi:unnamed protein product [Paramecium primaurelia]|nr:unnamed protein product [Paramecium primaurelia]
MLQEIQQFYQGGCFQDIKYFDYIFLLDAQLRNGLLLKFLTFLQQVEMDSELQQWSKIVNIWWIYFTRNDKFFICIRFRKPGIAPTPRAGHKMILTTLGGIVFGGIMNEKYSIEVYILDIVNENLLIKVVSGDIPIGRENFSMISHHGVAYVFGGYVTGVVQR